jgi:hypothetical protein
MALEYLHKDFPPIDAEEFEKIQREAPIHRITKDFVVPKNKR